MKNIDSLHGKEAKMARATNVEAIEVSPAPKNHPTNWHLIMNTDSIPAKRSQKLQSYKNPNARSRHFNELIGNLQHGNP